METTDLEALVDIPELPADIVLRHNTRQYLVNAPKSWQAVPEAYRMLYLRHLLHPKSDYGWQRLMRHWLHKKGIPKALLNRSDVFTSEQWQLLRYHFRHLDLSKLDGTVPLFTRFTVQKVEFQLIKEGFTDGCIYEYARATDYHTAVMEGKHDKLVDFLSVICRPVVNGHPQSLEHMGHLAERKAILSKLDQNDLITYGFAALRHFEACKQFIYTKWHPIFQSNASNTDANDGTIDLGWDGQIMSQASDMTKLPTVQQTNVHTFCYWLLKKKNDDDAYRRAMDKAGLKTD